MDHKLIDPKTVVSGGKIAYCSCFDMDDDQFFYGYSDNEIQQQFEAHIEEAA